MDTKNTVPHETACIEERYEHLLKMHGEGSDYVEGFRECMRMVGVKKETEKKLTEAEIMKALEDQKDLFLANGVFVRDALDLINSKNEKLRQCSFEHKELMKKVDRQKAEIEKWQQVNFDLCMAGGKLLHERKTIRAEAIKEVLQRARGKVCCIPQQHFTLEQVLYDLDQIAKEMGVEL